MVIDFHRKKTNKKNKNKNKSKKQLTAAGLQSWKS